MFLAVLDLTTILGLDIIYFTVSFSTFSFYSITPKEVDE